MLVYRTSTPQKNPEKRETYNTQKNTADILAALQGPLFGDGLLKRENTREKLQKIPAVAVNSTDKSRLKKLFTNIVKEWTRIVNTGAGVSEENRRKVLQLHAFVLEHNPDLNSLVKDIKGNARNIIKNLKQKKNPNQEAIDALTKVAEYNLPTAD